MSDNPLIDRLTVVFGEPERDDVDAYLVEIRRLTDHFGPAALDAAATALIRGGGRSWPAPKAMVDACVDAQEALGSRQPKPAMPRDIDADRARSWARDFCRSTELGQNAFRDGYGRQVYLWAQSYARDCLRQGETPSMEVRPREGVGYWFRYCRAPSHERAHPDAKSVVDWTETERAACLGEPLSGEVDAALGKRLAQLTTKALKRMPAGEPEEAPKPIGQLPKRIGTERPPLPVPDRDTWKERFGNRAAGLDEDVA